MGGSSSKDDKQALSPSHATSYSGDDGADKKKKGFFSFFKKGSKDEPREDEVVEPPVAERKCHDWPFAIVFLGLTAVVTFYGISGLVEFKNFSVCNQFGGDPPSPAFNTAFSSCLSPLLNGEAGAPGLCLQYSVTVQSPKRNSRGGGKPILHTSSAAPMKAASASPVESTAVARRLRGGGSGDTTPQPILQSLPSAVQTAVDQCLQHVPDPLSPSDTAKRDCVQYALGQVVGSSNASTLVNGCIGDAITAPLANASRRQCSRQVAVQLNASAGSVFDGCWNSTSTQSNAQILECLSAPNGLPSVLDSSQFSSIKDNCLTFALSTDVTAQGVAKCAGLSTRTLAPDSSALADDCVEKVLLSNSGAVQMCVKTALDQTFGVTQTYNFFKSGLEQALGSSGGSLTSGSCLAALFANPFGSVDCLLGSLTDVDQLARLACEVAIARTGLDVGNVYNSLGDQMLRYKDEVIITFVATVCVGIYMAVQWLIMIARHADSLIRKAIGTILMNLLFTAGFNFAIGNIPGAIIILVTLVLKMLWYCWIWKDIMFAAAILKTALRALKNNPAPFALGIAVFLLEALWCVLWAAAYFKLRDLPGLAGAVLVLSFFWTAEVLKNILAVTIIGTTSTWYFHCGRDMPKTPTLSAFLRAITFAFGSICFGSLIVAALATARYLIKKAYSTKRNWLKVLILCFLACLQQAVQTFNMYAFVQVATHGKSYLTAAKDTFKLVKKYGLTAVINDDLIDGVLATGTLMGALTCGGIAGLMARWVYDMPWSLTWVLMIVAFMFGYAMLSLATVVVEVASATLYVTFVQYPHGLKNGEPELYKTLTEAWIDRHGELPKEQPVDDEEEKDETDDKP